MIAVSLPSLGKSTMPSRIGWVVQPGHSSSLLWVSALMVATGWGLMAPRRLAYRMCLPAWNRFIHEDSTRSRGPVTFSLLLGAVSGAGSSVWLLLSGVCLACAAAVAALPILAKMTGHLWTALHDGFIWSQLFTPGLSFLADLLVVTIPLAFLGIALSCIFRLQSRLAGAKTSAVGAALLGIGLGTLMPPGSPNVATLAATLPILLVAVLGAMAHAPQAQLDSAEVRPDPIPLPTESDQRPVLLRASAGGAAMIAACFLTGSASADVISGRPFPVPVALAFIAIGLGWSTALWVLRKAVPPIMLLGRAFPVTGVLFAALSAVRGGFESLVGPFASIIATMAVFALGFALACGYEALFHRVVGGEAATLGRAILRGAIVGPFLMPVFSRWPGRTIITLFLAAALVSLGGIHLLIEARPAPFGYRARIQQLLTAIRTRFLQSSP
jgi:hypothetical protein